MDMILKSRRYHKFTAIPNELLNDKEISFKAKGFLCWALSKPENWCISASHVTKDFSIGRDAFYAIVDELTGAGYIERVQIFQPDGKFQGVEYIVKDDKTLTDLPLTGFPDTAKPDTEKADTNNKDLNNKEVNNTERVVSPSFSLTNPINNTLKTKKTKNNKSLELISQIELETPEGKAYTAFMKWIDSNAPTVNEMNRPISFREYLIIRQKSNNGISGYGLEQIQDVLKSMDNRATLKKDYSSAASTLHSWIKIRESKKPVEKFPS